MGGTVYIAHFSAPLGDPERPRMSALHYVGYAEPWRFEQRICEHLNGQGTKITRMAVQRGLSLTFFKIISGSKASREAERRIKNAEHFSDRICPICRQLTQNSYALDEPPF
jgi:hypothetical protein